jgi:hypothetical protein
MYSMNVKERIDAAVFLGDTLLNGDEYLDALVHRTSFHNKWFTKENQAKAIQSIAAEFLSREKLEAWVSQYHVEDQPNIKTVGLIMAGNIPLVGFHDFLSVFIAGHKSKIKLSEKDPFVFPYLLKILEKANPESARYFEVVEKLEDFEAVIATGSNNSARYFESYFGKYPHIIRKNRNSVGVLSGKETDAELLALGNDIFQYFGLGCRNVSKVYLPEGYDRKKLLEILHEYRELVLHDKYKHNFDYNFALLSLNRIPFDINGCIILTENPALTSRIAALHYEYYSDWSKLEEELQQKANEIQCVVTAPNTELKSIPTVSFGKAQQPGLSDYADGVDVMAFLTSL